MSFSEAETVRFGYPLISFRASRQNSTNRNLEARSLAAVAGVKVECRHEKYLERSGRRTRLPIELPSVAVVNRAGERNAWLHKKWYLCEGLLSAIHAVWSIDRLLAGRLDVHVSSQTIQL